MNVKVVRHLIALEKDVFENVCRYSYKYEYYYIIYELLLHVSYKGVIKIVEINLYCLDFSRLMLKKFKKSIVE